MILYLRIRVIFWMITESSSYVLISAFPNNVTSVLDGDLPTEGGPARACTVLDSCSNIAVRCGCVSWWLSASCRKGITNQSVCGERTVDSNNLFICLPYLRGSHVNPLSLVLSFHLNSLWCDFSFLALIFKLFCSDFYLLMGAIIVTLVFSYCLYA